MMNYTRQKTQTRTVLGKPGPTDFLARGVICRCESHHVTSLPAGFSSACRHPRRPPSLCPPSSLPLPVLWPRRPFRSKNSPLPVPMPERPPLTFMRLVPPHSSRLFHRQPSRDLAVTHAHRPSQFSRTSSPPKRSYLLTFVSEPTGKEFGSSHSHP